MSAACATVAHMDTATTYRSPSSSFGSSAERDASNGGFSSEVRNSSATMAGSGIHGTATRAIVAMRTRSQVTITRRYGYRSASALSTGPMPSQGR